MGAQTNVYKQRISMADVRYVRVQRNFARYGLFFRTYDYQPTLYLRTPRRVFELYLSVYSQPYHLSRIYRISRYLDFIQLYANAGILYYRA